MLFNPLLEQRHTKLVGFFFVFRDKAVIRQPQQIRLMPRFYALHDFPDRFFQRAVAEMMPEIRDSFPDALRSSSFGGVAISSDSAIILRKNVDKIRIAKYISVR